PEDRLVDEAFPGLVAAPLVQIPKAPHFSRGAHQMPHAFAREGALLEGRTHEAGRGRLAKVEDVRALVFAPEQRKSAPTEAARSRCRHARDEGGDDGAIDRAPTRIEYGRGVASSGGALGGHSEAKMNRRLQSGWSGQRSAGAERTTTKEPG